MSSTLQTTRNPPQLLITNYSLLTVLTAHTQQLYQFLTRIYRPLISNFKSLISKCTDATTASYRAATRLYATITHYLQDHYALATSSLTRQQLASALKQQGVADAEVNAWLSLLSEIELARYAPQQEGDSLPCWVDQLERLISQS